MTETDLDLLARYTRQHAEDAFAEIVRRQFDHLSDARTAREAAIPSAPPAQRETA